MRKYALLCLTLMLACFISGGVYIITSIDGVTENLQKVNAFHRVEFLRENLVNRIKVVQSNLLLQRTPHSIDFETVVQNVEQMEDSTEVCLTCHHSEETKNRLKVLNQHVEYYMTLISRSLTIRANQQRLENARMMAFNEGEKLLKDVNSLSIASAERIGARIDVVTGDINATNNFLIACVILGPIAIIGITAFFLRRFTGSIDELVVAAEALKNGNLDYRITTPMKNEFRTLAEAFNGMVDSLNDERQRFESMHTLYQTLFESAGDAIMITSLEKETLGLIVSANPAASELYGYPLEELIGMNIINLIPGRKEKQFQERMKHVLSGEWRRMQVKRVHKNGHIIPLDLSVGLLEMDNRKYLLSFCKDISDRMKAEEELQRANQMALVGQMAAGLAHEIKNPLAGIKVSLDLLSSELDLLPDDKELFARMISEINRMERLLKSLLNYARPPQPQFDLVEINRLLDNSIKNVEMTATKDPDKTFHFERDFSDDLKLVEADSAQLQQVFLNIMINAIDAMPDGGTVRTTTRMEGDRVRIEIADSGKGLPVESLDKIFNPFFTTKTRGTGLGLAICKRLIEQHEGDIVAVSEYEKGTTLIITLPILQQKEGDLYE